jgi:hypothetical protein
MKRTFKISALVIGMMALAITGCKKDKVADQKETTTQTSENDADILALVNQAEEAENNMEAVYDEAAEDMSIANEGIAADFLVEDNDIDADENSTDATVAKRKQIRKNSFIFCLRKLDLHCDQTAKIKHALKDYKDCRESSIKRARAIYANLYAKYKKLAVEQARLFKAGKITKEEYTKNITRIRYAFHKELRELKLKEKLNAALKNCYSKFLRNLKGVLSDKQWAQFVCCYRGH